MEGENQTMANATSDSFFQAMQLLQGSSSRPCSYFREALPGNAATSGKLFQAMQLLQGSSSRQYSYFREALLLEITLNPFALEKKVFLDGGVCYKL